MPSIWKFILFKDSIGEEISTQTKIYNRWIKKNKVVYSIATPIDVKSLQIKYKKPITYQETQYHRLVTVYDKQLKPTPYQPVNGLLIGKSLDKIESLKINTELNHLLLSGVSGSGKSTSARTMILNSILQDIEIYVHDNKSSNDYDIFKNHLHLSKGIEEFSDLLKELENKINSHNKKPILVFIDEVFVLKLGDKKEKFYDRLALILSTARSFNIHFVIISQRCTTEILPSALTTHCSNRICLQTSTKQESQNMIYCEDAYYVTKKGYGYFSINGKLKQITTFYLTDDEINNLLPPVEFNQIIEETSKSYLVGGVESDN